VHKAVEGVQEIDVGRRRGEGRKKEEGLRAG
jgi:hypothetical protein